MAKRGPAATTAPLDDERLLRIAQNARAGVFEADERGALTFVSPRFCELFGLDPAQTPHTRWLGAVHPQDRDAVTPAWREAVAAAQELDLAFRVQTGGEIRRVHLSCAPICNDAGLVTAFAGAVFDLTDLTKAGAEIAQFSSVAEVIPQLMWIAAPDGAIEYFNRPWLEYTAVDVEAMRESGVKNVVHPDDLAHTWEYWNRALLTGEPYEIEYRLRNAKSGRYRWFIARATPYRNERGELVRWIGTATDIDAQKRANDNLRFVLDASSALTANLNVDGVCSTLANLAIQRIADWCFIVLLTEQGAYQTHAIAHRDPDRLRMVEDAGVRYPVRKGSPLDRVIRRNTPILIPSLTQDELTTYAQDEDHLHLLQSLGMHSAMLLPLSAGDGTVYGGIAMVSSESARTYTPTELEVAEMVAQRAAAAIHTARAFAQERSRSDRLHFIAQASELLVEAADLRAMLDRLTRLIVESAADLAYVILAENHEALRTVACAHAEPGKEAVAARLRGQRTLRPEAEENAVWLLSQHRTLLHKHVPIDTVLAAMWEYLAPEVLALDIKSAITVPLFSRGETFGALVVYRCGTSRAYTEEDAALFTDLGRRVSIAIEHQRAVERERRIAEALQQALLPQPGMLPAVEGLHFAAHYRPSTRESEVGGDWYDAVSLSDGSILVSVGDVTGRGLQAAGLMGKLRQAIGVSALYERDPARILDAVDFHLRSRRSSSLATAFVGIIEPDRNRMRYAGAGHPPPLLRRAGELLELRATGLPLGLRDQGELQNSEQIGLEDAELLILYTDGLVEATRDLSFGEQRLAFLASSEAISYVRNPAAFLCDACLPPDAQDDTAVLTVSFGGRTSWAFDAENAQAAHEARSQLVAYLRERSPEHADLAAAELVFGELVGNVVRHAPGPIEVHVDWRGSRPVLHVIDRGRGFVRDPSLPPDMLSESGRGLYIVSQLTNAFTVERISGYGNHVAAHLRL